MQTVVVSYEKSDKEDKITYSLINAENLPEILENADISFDRGDCRGEVFFFESKEDAEGSMGAKFRSFQKKFQKIIDKQIFRRV